MVRPRKDKFEEVSYAFRKGTEHELIQVSIPFWLNATIMNKYGHGTTIQPVCELELSKDQIRKLFKKEKCKIIKFEQFTTKLPNFCERCGRTGVPTILKKSNFDNRVRSTTQYPSRNKRPDDYRLVYQHTEKPKICTIATFDVRRRQELLNYTNTFSHTT